MQRGHLWRLVLSLRARRAAHDKARARCRADTCLPQRFRCGRVARGRCGSCGHGATADCAPAGAGTDVAKRCTAVRRADCGGRSTPRGLFRPLEPAVSDIGTMQVGSQSELRRSKTPVLLSRGARDRTVGLGGGPSVRASRQSRSVCQTGVIIRLSMRHSLSGPSPRPEDCEHARRERCRFQYWGICSSESTGGARRGPRASGSARREQAFARRMSIC